MLVLFFRPLDKWVVFWYVCAGGHSVGPPPALLQVTGAAVQPVQASKEPFFSRKQDPDLQQPACAVS